MKLSEQVAELEEKANRYELRCITLQQENAVLKAQLAVAQAENAPGRPRGRKER